MTAAVITRRAIVAQAWPIMIGQITVPLVGLVDTAVIGRTGDAVALAAVALGSFVVTFLFWTFGFLRMGMTGLTAQAEGAKDAIEVRALLIRGIAMGFGLGLALLALQVALIPLAFRIFAGSGQLDAVAEGITSAGHLKVLQEIGCTHGQGPLFSPAVDAAGVTAMLQQRPW